MVFLRKKKRVSLALNVEPPMASLTAGESAQATVRVFSTVGSGVAVELAAGVLPEGGGLPEGITVTINPAAGATPFQAVMEVTASPKLAPGAYPFLVIAAGGDARVLSTYTLIVRAGGPKGSKST